MILLIFKLNVKKFVKASDATATFDKKPLDGDHYSSELVHTISLLSLDNEFAQIIDYKNLIKKI